MVIKLLISNPNLFYVGLNKILMACSASLFFFSQDELTFGPGLLMSNLELSSSQLVSSNETIYKPFIHKLVNMLYICSGGLGQTND